tara:strand:+ start:164 stop:772 length:609 start_codon:yes stop_codon:yes gene_type:complete
MTNYYNILSYLGIITFVVYSAFSVHYYNKIAKERMIKGTSFCVNDHTVGPDEISTYQMVALTLLAISLIVFIMKLNHDVFAKCNYEEGKAAGIISKLTTNTQFWWAALVLTIYGLSIYELADLDKLKKCKEDETDNGGLIAVNAIVVAIISLMILLFLYRFVKGEKEDIMGGSVDLGNFDSIYKPEASGDSSDIYSFNYNYN